MVQHLYPNFLTDARVYALSEELWDNLWKEVMRVEGLARDWKSPWLGTPLADGDPIFSAVSQAQRRGVHVIQHAPTSDNVEIVSWQDKFGEEGVDEIIDQLVIACTLSREATAQARELLQSWVVRGTLESVEKQVEVHRD